jgi:hypothetical protein
VAAQGLAVVGLGVLQLVEVLLGNTAKPGLAAVGALITALGGVALLLLALALPRLRGWARTPVVVLEVLMLPVAWGLIQSGLWTWALLVGLPPLVVCCLLATPAARGAFAGR